MKSAGEKAAEWQAYTEATEKERALLERPTLAVGTVVRATRLLDEVAAHVIPGTIGFVFGEANCYADDCGPIVQWFAIPNEPQDVGPVADIEEHFTKCVVAASVCNVYPGDIRIVRVHDTVLVGHINDRPDDEMLEQVKNLLHYSLKPVEYKYIGLTREERALVTTDVFARIVKWLGLS